MEPNKNIRRILRNSTDQSIFDMGKMPPMALDFEEVVLGALMLEDCINQVIGVLEPASFYKDAHNRIFKAILALFGKSYPINILTVTKQLKESEELEIVGGGYYITSLTNRIASSANIEFNAKIVQQKFIQRQLIKISTESINDAYEDSADVFNLLENAEKKLFDIAKTTYKKEAKSSASLVNEVVNELEIVSLKPDGLSGIPSGIISLDRLTCGWQKSDLIIIAARPAMGKTALAISIGKNAAMQFRKPVAIFSLEMSEKQLMKRVIASDAEINGFLFKNPKLLEDHHWNKIRESMGRISNSPFYIDDTPSLSIFELRAKSRRMKERLGIELIIIDYLQLMTTGADDVKRNREQEISYISRSLKALAKELDIPVIALSQLSRAVEGRGGEKRPQLSDLRESGAIEQDADMVIFPHRPEYYGVTEDAEGNSTIGKAELILAKHREGATDTAIVRYIAPYTLFCNIEHESNYSNKNLEPDKNFTINGKEEDMPF